MVKNLVLAILLLCCISGISAQSQNENGHFMVEFDAFSPPIKDMIDHFEGRSLIPFMASDLNGKEHFNGNYKGKTLILFFWKKDCTLCLDQLQNLNSIKATYDARDIQIISLYNEDKASAKTYVQDYGVDFPVIANAQILSEGAYGSDIGYPRVFIVDSKGITQKVIPEEAFLASTDGYLLIQKYLEIVLP
ncbi:MAG: TlpA disulfide reductase family protein [Bacteroidota bacterium]